MKKTLFLLFILMNMSPLYAEKEVLPPDFGENLVAGDLPILKSESSVPLVMNVGCYGANNRHTNNPISPESKMTTTIKAGGKTFVVKWPAHLTRGLSGTVSKLADYYKVSIEDFCTANPNLCKNRTAPTGCSDFNTCSQAVFDDSGNNAVTEFMNISKKFPKSSYGGVNSQKYDAKMASFYQGLFLNNELNKGTYWGSLHGKFFKHFSNLCSSEEKQGECVRDHSCEAVCMLRSSGVQSCINTCRSSVAASDDVTSSCTINGTNALTCERFIISNLSVTGDKSSFGAVQVSHHQKAPWEGKREFFAYTGATTGRDKVKVLYSGDKVSGIELSSFFPGQDGYCGGYHSPLMLFFDHKHPKFTGKSKFLDDGKKIETYWPEKNHHGYFLARLNSLKSKDYRITSPDQLFGNNGAYADGFAVLKNFDEDQNGYISKSDPVFKKLVLWKDKNSDGKSSPDELIPLKSKGITKIYTSYDSTFHLDYAKRAKARGKSYFEYKSKKGKLKKGDVLDLFFSEIYR